MHFLVLSRVVTYTIHYKSFGRRLAVYMQCRGNIFKAKAVAYVVSSFQVVFEDLVKAREGFVLASDLHLLYEVTPTYVDLEPDWTAYYQHFVELSPIDQVGGLTTVFY